VKILVEEYYVYLDPVEDLIAVYLDGWRNKGSTEDRDKAIWLMATWTNKLDLEYLEEICRSSRVFDKLVELKQLLSI